MDTRRRGTSSRPPWQRPSSAWLLQAWAWLVLFFLMLPLLVIVPLSFNAEPFLNFTEGMLKLDPQAYSLQWYDKILSSTSWLTALRNSTLIAIFATLIATFLGTLAAVGLASADMPLRRTITALLLAPMIVPLIIVAAGMFFFYSRLGLVSTFTGLIIAHAALGVPFVIITVTASLAGFDRTLYQAGLSLGATPWRTFRTVVVPMIRPGVISGALFAFATSFDEIVLVLFLAGPEQNTIPRRMFTGLRELIDPSLLAVASLLMLMSIALLAAMLLLQRRSERMRAHIR